MVTKKTIKELLGIYLKEKGLDEDNIKEVQKRLHKGVKIRKKLQKTEEPKPKKKTRVIHGTSCPRIMNEYGELIDEY